METSSYGSHGQEDLTNLVSMNPSQYDGTHQEQYTEPVVNVDMSQNYFSPQQVCKSDCQRNFKWHFI